MGGKNILEHIYQKSDFRLVHINTGNPIFHKMQHFSKNNIYLCMKETNPRYISSYK